MDSVGEAVGGSFTPPSIYAHYDIKIIYFCVQEGAIASQEYISHVFDFWRQTMTSQSMDKGSELLLQQPNSEISQKSVFWL